MRVSPDIEPPPTTAFTLVEVVTGLAVLLLLVALLGQILNQVSGAWSVGESRKERLQNLRMITDFMGEELQAALLPLNRADKTNLRFVVNPDDIPNSYLNRDAIFWFTPLAADSSRGEVAAAGYFVRWNAQKPAAELCRFFLNPSETYYHTDANQWLKDSVLDAVAPGSSAPGCKGLVAENVIGLWVRCLDAYGKPITEKYGGGSFPNAGFDSTLGYTDSEGEKSAAYTDSSGYTISYCVLPKAVDFGFAMLDAGAAGRLTSDRKQTIQSLAASSDSAAAFVEAAQTEPALAALKQGLRNYQTRVFLQNSR